MYICCKNFKRLFPKNTEICISLEGGNLYVTYRNDDHVILKVETVEVLKKIDI